MTDQLIRYVDLLFAGAPNLENVKQDVLQNTLDYYNDLVDQGIAPEAAYTQAICAIGDIGQIIAQATEQPVSEHTAATPHPHKRHIIPSWKRIMEAIAIGLYILCPIPLIILSDIGQELLGLSILLSIVAVATAILIIASNHSSRHSRKEPSHTANTHPHIALRKKIGNVIHTVGIISYLLFSFLTQAWYVTWLVFPIMAALQGLVNACLDLKEGKKDET